VKGRPARLSFWYPPLQTDAPPLTVPQRVQLKRTKGWRLPPKLNCVVVSRPSPFGNPFTLTDVLLEHGGKLDARDARAEAIRRFKIWLGSEPYPEGRFADLYPERKGAVLRRLPDLRGKDLACWCPLGYPDGSGCPCLPTSSLPWLTPVLSLS
jgi:hypothetical protein